MFPPDFAQYVGQSDCGNGKHGKQLHTPVLSICCKEKKKKHPTRRSLSALLHNKDVSPVDLFMACRYVAPEQSAATGSLHFYKWTLKGREKVSCVIVAAFFPPAGSRQAAAGSLSAPCGHANSQAADGRVVRGHQRFKGDRRDWQRSHTNKMSLFGSREKKRLKRSQDFLQYVVMRE